jgi:hypothetical protein
MEPTACHHVAIADSSLAQERAIALPTPSFKAYVSASVLACNTIYFSKTIALTQQWQDFTIDAGSDAAEELSYLTLMLGAAGQRIVDVDDFTLQETAP